MKNLFLIIGLFMAMVSTSNAQYLQYKMGNFDTETWVVQLNDAGPTGNYPESLAPGAGATDFIPKFQFPLQYKALSTSGCQVNGAFTGTTTPAGATLSTSCGIDIIYTLIMVKPNVYKLKMKIN